MTYYKNLFGVVVEECNISTSLIEDNNDLTFIDYWMYLEGFNKLVN